MKKGCDDNAMVKYWSEVKIQREIEMELYRIDDALRCGCINAYENVLDNLLSPNVDKYKAELYQTELKYLANKTGLIPAELKDYLERDEEDN